MSPLLPIKRQLRSAAGALLPEPVAGLLAAAWSVAECLGPKTFSRNPCRQRIALERFISYNQTSFANPAAFALCANSSQFRQFAADSKVPRFDPAH